MPSQRSEEDELVIEALSASILREMLLEHVGDLTLEQAQQHKATRTVCGRCGKRCRDRSICPPLHPIPQTASSIASGSGGSGGPTSSMLQKSRSSTPLGFSSSSGMDLSGFGTVTSSGTTVSRAGVVFLDCLICGRPIASHRYAPHLASCLGLTGSARRGTSRAAAASGMQRTKLQAQSSFGTGDRASLDGDASDDARSEAGWSVGGSGKRNGSPSKAGSSGGRKIQVYGRKSSPTKKSSQAGASSSHPLAQSNLPPRSRSSSLSPSRSSARGVKRKRPVLADDDDDEYQDAEGEDDDAEGEEDDSGIDAVDDDDAKSMLSSLG